MFNFLFLNRLSLFNVRINQIIYAWYSVKYQMYRGVISQGFNISAFLERPNNRRRRGVIYKQCVRKSLSHSLGWKEANRPMPLGEELPFHVSRI